MKPQENILDTLNALFSSSPAQFEAARTSLSKRLGAFLKEHGNLPLTEETLKMFLDEAYPHPEEVEFTTFQSIEFKNGICKVPSNWIVATVDNPDHADFACAVSVKKNESNLDMPVFLVFLDKHPNNLTRHDYMRIMESCKAKYPDFGKVIEKEIYYNGHKYVDNFGHEYTRTDYAKAPWVGVFLIDPMCQSKGLTYGCQITYSDEWAKANLRKKMTT